MRRYRIVPWILLILSIIDFTLAVPVSVRDVHGVRVNAVGVAEDRIAALQKRMDDDHGGESDLDPGEGNSDLGESESDLEVGGGEYLSDIDDGGEWGSDLSSEHGLPYHGGPESESESESNLDAGSDRSGSDSDGDVGGENGGEAVEEVGPENNENQADQHQPDEENQSSDDEAHDQEQSPPHSPGPQAEDDNDFSHSPESQYHATFKYEDLLDGLLRTH